MSQYLKSNIEFPDRSHHYAEAEVSQMTSEEFYELPICDAMYIFNHFPNEYARLTGYTPTDTTPQGDSKATAKAFADEFERVVDTAIASCFHPNGV